MKQKQSFLAYSDESGTFDHPFQSIAIISGQEATLSQLRNDLSKILDDNDIPEVHFSDISVYGSAMAKAARQFINISISNYVIFNKIRIDIITWGISDIISEDQDNLKYMYYLVLVFMARSWCNVSWIFYPDINSKIDWQGIRKQLNIANFFRYIYKQRILMDLPDSDYSFHFSEIQQLDSIQEPLIQLADLFSGIARYSGEKGYYCVQWLHSHPSYFGKEHQLEFDNFCPKNNETTGHDRCIYQLIGNLYKTCKKYKLGVSLATNNRLCTMYSKVHNRPINFWNYKPQDKYDTAPVK